MKIAEDFKIRVGIMTAPKIDVEFHGVYMRLGNQYQPVSGDSYFTLQAVAIGKGFHWERKEEQSFNGTLELIDTGNLTTAVNILPLEEYLRSVISSEMAATTHPQLLMAHAIISRTWALSILLGKNGNSIAYTTQEEDIPADATVRWYDADAHEGYDVCADDHCQRYQGITRITRPEVDNAVKQTEGMVLTSDGILCDARYSKCCGGAFEEFNTCWGSYRHPYLVRGRDIIPNHTLPDLTDEANARRWILDRPDAFCSDVPASALNQILNSYDRENFISPGNDYYRWHITYRPGELEAILREKTGLDFGTVTALRPLRRGVSARIWLLEVVGEKATHIFGKELEIRRVLSTSHLPSSAFVASRQADGSWCLDGGGWGHGVGLCQIGAAVMALRGFNYRQILTHYYPGSQIQVAREIF